MIHVSKQTISIFYLFLCDMLSVHSDTYFMQQALAQAKLAYELGEVPVGAVFVCENRIIARAHNQTERLTDVTAHAEILALTAASNYLGSKYLNDCTLFVTLEPCVMCAGALSWAQVGRVVFGASDEKRGFMLYGGKDLLHPKTKLELGIMEAECAALLTSFFKAKR
ncbi:MAG: nucleoside deaminase [Chitinophagales bacterium]|jgi:tRNA(adenine34) deaminase